MTTNQDDRKIRNSSRGINISRQMHKFIITLMAQDVRLFSLKCLFAYNNSALSRKNKIEGRGFKRQSIYHGVI